MEAKRQVQVLVDDGDPIVAGGDASHVDAIVLGVGERPAVREPARRHRAPRRLEAALAVQTRAPAPGALRHPAPDGAPPLAAGAPRAVPRGPAPVRLPGREKPGEGD